MVFQEIPIMIVFRALGFVSDLDILEHIIYEQNDPEMVGLHILTCHFLFLGGDGETLARRSFCDPRAAGCIELHRFSRG